MQFPDRVYVYMCDTCGETRFQGFWSHRERGALGGKKCSGSTYRQAYQAMKADPVQV